MVDENLRSVRAVLVIAGLGGFEAGIAAIFFGRDGAASAALITMGMIALGLLATNMDSFKACGVAIELLDR